MWLISILTTTITTTTTTTAMSLPPPAKKTRLTTACNECRRRKVKCDANHPKCTNCYSRNSICFTSDPRRPDVPIVREWVEISDKHNQNAPDTQNPLQNPPRMAPSLEELERSTINEPPLPIVANDTRISSAMTQPRPQPQQPSLQPLNRHTRSINGNLGTQAVPEPNEVSPLQQPHDMSFNIDSVNNRFKMLGASSAQCLTKSFDIYLKSYSVEPVSALFRHGMQHAEEMDLPLTLELVPFPENSTRQAYLRAYFTRIHVFYPITDIDDTKAIIHRIAGAPLPDLKSLNYTQVPLLAMAYLLMSLGADELNDGPSEVGTKYLKVGCTLAGHSINFPYMTTVQCLLLLAVCYRGR